jgi:VWFA-related protein
LARVFLPLFALLLFAAVAASAQAQQEPTPAPEEVLPAPRFADRIAVERVVMDLRIVDGKGRPIPDLSPADVRVTVDGREAAVDSLKWVSGTTPYAEGLPPEVAEKIGVAPAPPGRLILFFFQKDMAGSRLPGLMQMKTQARKLLGSLEPGDRVAVASFDSQLRLWTDFTDDRPLLRRVLERSVLMENAPDEIRPGSPSLLPGYDRATARRAASTEAGLVVLANALAPLPGIKSMAFFGWGLGELSGGLVHMLPEYENAQRALRSARVVVFSLDVTDADYHTLEVGLQQVAEDTGGFYARTRDFPRLAMDRLENALLGYYTLSFEKPLVPRGVHDVKVRLVAGKGDVLLSGTYVD